MNDQSGAKRRTKSNENLGDKCELLPSWTPRKDGRCKRWTLCRMDGRAGSDGCTAKGGIY